MKLELIVNKYKKTEKEPKYVWANLELDELRKKECLCLNCDRKNEYPPYNSCYTADKIHEICVKNGMAMAITRCGAIDEYGNLMYKPTKK